MGWRTGSRLERTPENGPDEFLVRLQIFKLSMYYGEKLLRQRPRSRFSASNQRMRLAVFLLEKIEAKSSLVCEIIKKRPFGDLRAPGNLLGRRAFQTLFAEKLQSREPDCVPWSGPCSARVCRGPSLFFWVAAVVS